VASIQKIKDRNRWRVRWREGGRGSPMRSSKWFDSKKEAMAELKAREDQLAARKTANALIPLEELIRRWENRQRERRQARNGRYIEESARTMRRVLRENKWRYCSDVRELDLGPGAFRLMRALLRYGMTHHGQTVHHLALVAPDRQRAKRTPAPLPSLEDVLHMIEKARRWSAGNGAIAHLVAVYGHRPESLIKLTTDAVERSYVGLTPAGGPVGQAWLTLKVKGGREVRHPLLPATVEILAPVIAQAAPGGVIFRKHHLDPKKKFKPQPWKYGRDWSSWFRKSIGEGRGIYRLKCWAITWMFAGGLDVETISSITGHSTDTVRRYLRTNEAKQQDALAVIARSGVIGVANV